MVREDNADPGPSEKHADKKEVAPADRSVPFLKLFSFASPLDVVLMLVGSVGGAVNGVSMPLIALLFGQLVDAFGKNNNSEETLDDVTRVRIFTTFFFPMERVREFMQVTCWMIAGERQAARIRGLYLKAILRQDVAFFDKESATGEVVGRMSGDTILIQDAIGEKVGKVIQLVSTFIGGFAVAFAKGWKLTLMMLVTIPPMVVVGAVVMTVISKATSRGQNAYAEAGDVVEQALGAMRTVAAFVGEKKSIEAYRRKLKIAYAASIRQGIASGFGLGAFMLIMFSSYSLAFWYGAKLIVNSGYSGGTVVNVVFAVLMGGMSLGQASPSLNAFGAGKAAAYKMFQVIDRVPDIDAFNLTGEVPKNIRGEIDIRSVDFSYPARPDVKIFSNFIFHVSEGITAALVGESGSGKSTVISLIERFYDPQAGTILLDGVDIKKLQLKWLRQQIGLVSQEPVLFGTSIKDNIAYGKDGATLEEIKQAAVLANASNFISGLPKGYDTLVGEHGTQLSGGQKQRVAIARAILKNPCILLLDEATSALDAESERLVQEAVDRVMMGRTTVVVAHRLTTIRNADVIAVIQHGAIVEQGKHEELLQSTTGAYSQLIHLQQMHREKESFADGGETRLSSQDQRSERRSGSHKFQRRSSSLNSDSDESFRSASLRQSRKEVVQHPRKNILGWCGPKVIDGDLETGERRKAAPEVSIFRLASLNKPEAPIFALGVSAAVANGCIFPVYGLLMSSIIKVFFEPRDQLTKDANFWALMFLVIACVAFIVLPVQMICFGIGGNRLIQRVRQLTFEKVLRQEISWFDESDNASGAISARLSGDAAQVRAIVGDTLSLAVQNFATIVAALAIAFSASWLLSLVVLAIVPLLGLQGLAHVKFMKGFSADAKVMYEDASQVASDAVGSIRTVASFCAEDKVMILYHDKCRSPLAKGVRQGFMSGSIFGFANFVMFAAYSLCFWFGAKLVKNGQTNFEDVFKAFFAISMGALSVSQSTSLLPDVSNAKAAVNSVFALLDRQSKIDSAESSGLTRGSDSVVGNIEFRHVSFRYPSRPDVKVLRDLSLSVKAGKTVALVGESGCGKSTVIALLERFYDPDSGHIYLDGTDIKKLQVRWLRQQMGLVGQEPVLFNTTIRENITYGMTGPVSEEQVIEAAQASNAHKFITELPDGYETSVGERGIQLSGGQKQRVAIARAIIKNPKILLLDEATSALDAESEHVVQEALEKVMLQRSVIVIAHRLSTIKNADVIAVVKDGVVIEQGRHEELMRAKDGAYATLVRLHMTSA
ncbi:hypothetical protein L7F22_004449 [Adiantum nelumboides]|nr:hypothetical protein [Adiantum nelumboides]